MTPARRHTDARTPLRAVLGVIMALALALFLAPVAPETAKAGSGHRAWLVAAPSGLAALHHRETALRQSIAPQAEPVALPPPEALAPQGLTRWTKAQGAPLPPGADGRRALPPHARAPPLPLI